MVVLVLCFVWVVEFLLNVFLICVNEVFLSLFCDCCVWIMRFGVGLELGSLGVVTFITIFLIIVIVFVLVIHVSVCNVMRFTFLKFERFIANIEMIHQAALLTFLGVKLIPYVPSPVVIPMKFVESCVLLFF